MLHRFAQPLLPSMLCTHCRLKGQQEAQNTERVKETNSDKEPFT